MKKHGISTVLLGLALSTTAAATDVGVAWVGKSGMAARVLAGVEERLAEIAPDIKLDIRPELASVDDLHKTVTEFKSTGKSAQIVLRSNGTAYLGENPPSIPTFIGGNNHPVELGAVSSMEAPDGFVTGVTYHIPLTPTLESFMTLFPYMDSVLLISQKNYSSSAIDWRGTEEACKTLELSCAQALVGSKEELVKAVNDNKGKYSAIVMGNQSLVFDNAALIIEASPDTPLFSYAENGVLKGAAGGVIADDHKLGRMLAESLVDVIINGKEISEVPIKRDPEPVLMINMAAIDRYGLAVPAMLLSIAELVE